jgi:DNA-binding response OmpR family regulator
VKILLLEDDYMLSDIIVSFLKEKFYDVVQVEDGESAVERASTDKFDLMIFDINVPKLSGINVVKNIRSYSDTTPIILITAYQDTAHLKKGFNSGCDDYIKKPFDLEELELRINNIKKRFSIESDDKIEIDNETYIIPSKNLLIIKDKNLQLANKETQILLYLSSRKKIVISSNELIQNIWRYEDMPTDATIRVYIKNLRSTLGKNKIKTIRGSGYYFE